ncbi:MAG: twin-arginine translocation signal domain-containing protein [Maioricimonas sp. JB045]
MSHQSRRTFLQSTAALAASTGLSGWTAGLLQAETESVSELSMAPFRFDVSPPLGHPCCGGWIKPVVGYDDPQEAIGFIVKGTGKPIVVCSVDWTGILNEAHVAFRTALAEAAGTTPDRVAVQCVHPHNAPFACLEAERITQEQGDLPHIVFVDFFNECLDRGRKAVAAAAKSMQPVTHVASGEAKVQKVAGNRRILGEDGKVRAQRGSSCRDPELRALPEGLIDPYLKTVAFYSGETKLVACHYYACHPMSYYGDGRVSADFCGLARRKREQDEPGCTHIYFNGCGGNIGAGKYNDGSKEMRTVLTQRMYDGIVASEESLSPQPIESLKWTTQEILPPTGDRWDADAILKQIENKSLKPVQRNRPAYTWAWIRRQEKGIPIVLSGLHVNDVSMLHLPAECFVEYQLAAQKIGAGRFVACAAYGDGGPWYIPTAESYPQGGYAVSVAWCDSQVEDVLTGGIRSLLS